MPRVHLTNDLVGLVRKLHPEIKKRVRSALDLILVKPYSGKALKGELFGLRSFRLGKIRIIYKILEDSDIEIIALGPRKTIYEETYWQIKKSQK